MSHLLEVIDIEKRFGSMIALRDTNLSIARGKITALLGPSGSGKTTLLRILAGLESPTTGRILYDNNLITASNRQILRQNGTMVFQKSVFFDTTVFKNVAYGLKLRGNSRMEITNRVGEVLDLVGLKGFEKRRAGKLSGGEQQRVSLARALVLNTELLLLDEPTVNMDPKNVSIIEETILRVKHDHKTTVVLATHNMFQAEAISDRAALILGGTIRHVGTNQEVFGNSNKHLASFARLENVFTGISRISKDNTSIIDVNGHLSIEASFTKPGKVTIYVRPEDILLSSSPFRSSARNTFKGRISGVSDLGSIVKLRVDTGKEFVVQITAKSFMEMQLNLGSAVFLTFKASSVHLV